MAQLWSDIKITTCEGRPCWVNGRRAIFHRWTDSARPVRKNVTTEDGVEHFQKYSVHGLVEYEDGTMAREWPNVIQFADSWEYFQRFDWEAMERRQDAKEAAAAEIADETDRDKLMEAAVAALRELGHNLPPVNIEVAELQVCDTCAHENPLLWADQCGENGYNCPECHADCICKDCDAGNKWEPKGGAV